MQKTLEQMMREGREGFRQDFTSDCEGERHCIKGQLDKLDQHTANTWRAAPHCETRERVTQDRDQVYTSLVEGIKAQVKDINGEGSVFDDFATDIIENVVKPLYNKTGDKAPCNTGCFCYSKEVVVPSA